MKDRIAKTTAFSEEAVRIAVDAWIYGFPLVVMAVTRDVMTAVASPDEHKAPINQFLHIREFPNPTFTDVVSPNGGEGPGECAVLADQGLAEREDIHVEPGVRRAA